jgi:hypothetical protein
MDAMMLLRTFAAATTTRSALTRLVRLAGASMRARR